MKVRAALAPSITLLALSLTASFNVLADPLDQSQPFARTTATRPAAFEMSWTPLRLPTGDRIAMAGATYFVAVDEDWGFGPSFYGAAKGNYGGLITMGFTAQRRWRLWQNTHLAAGLSVAAGGGVSSDQVRFGGGLMLRPEVSIRTEFDSWYAGVSLAQIRFPSGNVNGTSLGLVLGHISDFNSFSPSDSGRRGMATTRTGFGFDEVVLFGGFYKPTSSSRNRSGDPLGSRMGTAGADMRQYIADGSWWGVEAAGAAQGGADGYMEALLTAGQDWALWTSGPRLGLQLGAGLGGGGGVDTGSGWLVHAGPSARWDTPWGASLHLDGGLARSYSGHFTAPYVHVGLGLPLDRLPSVFDANDSSTGVVRNQQMFAGLEHLSTVHFKDGSSAPVTELAIVMTRELTSSFYGVAQAGSAAVGHAGAYSFGLFGLGLQSPYVLGQMRFGVEALAGAGGGGGVAVGGGAIGQAEAWGEWVGSGELDRLRLRAGIGEWRTLRGSSQSSPMLSLSVGYAFGALAR